MTAKQRSLYLEYVLLDYLTAPAGPVRDRALDAAVQAYDYLVHATIERYPALPYGIAREDVEQAGRIALFQALEAYRPYDKARFTTYAISSIRNAISGALSDHAWSKCGADHERAISGATHRLTAELGRHPNALEVADALSVSPERLSQMLTAAGRNRPVYLLQHSGPAADESDLPDPPIDVLPDESCDVCETVIARHMADALIAEISKLSSQERQVALLTAQGCTPFEIAELMGLRRADVNALTLSVRMQLRDALSTGPNAELFAGWLTGGDGLPVGRILNRRRAPKIFVLL